MNIKRRIIAIVIGIIFVIGIITFYRTFSLEDNYKMNSQVYRVEDGYIKDISPNTDIGLFLDYFDLENCSLKVVDNANNEIANGYVYNGSKTLLYDAGGRVISSYINIVKGDYYSDGIIDDRDYTFWGRYFIHSGELKSYEKEALDINLDGDVRINDLVMFRDAIEGGITELNIDKEEMILQTNEMYRLVVRVFPNYGVNTNLKWSSSNDNVATVSQSGVVTGGNLEGEAIIKAETQEGKKFIEVKVTLDNTIQLNNYNGTGYVNGNDVIVNIKSVSYDDLSCHVKDSNVASCRIKDKKLYMTAIRDGSTEVYVNSNKYGDVTYYLDCHSVYLKVMPRYLCKGPNSAEAITVSSFYSGDYSFSSTDLDIVKDSHMENIQGREMLKITMGNKTGRAFVTVTEGNANTSRIVTIDVYKIDFDGLGRVVKVGNSESVLLKDGNLGDVSCKADNEEIATCSIEGNNMIINGISKGYTSLTISNSVEFEGNKYNCGSRTFGALVSE